MKENKKNKTVELTIHPVDGNWKDYYTRQVRRISKWFGKDNPTDKLKLEELDSQDD